ncbi:transcriptional regulator [Paenibacillus sp. YN15]|nr:transcriptional regulator [Paenibacillus sp. YN15]RAU95070.1 transcriptional regulator [Paenibacillus sp. YN15]
MTGTQVWMVILALLIVIAQSLFLFIDARKRGRFPWLWGLWGLIHAPLPLIVYFLTVRRTGRRT